jgi:CDP-paratose 2-epimerase
VATAVVSGSGGLIGSESVRYFVEQGFSVVGLENDLRARFFGPEASTRPVTERLTATYPEFRSLAVDIRDADAVMHAFRRHRADPRTTAR